MAPIKSFSVFFNNDQEFDQILGKTSYYMTMQNQMSALIKTYQPFYIIEFGSGAGNTAFRIAKENTQLSLVAVDNRPELVSFCQNKKEFKQTANLTFISGDLTKLDTFNFINVDLVYMLYSFNYINDPDDNKKAFLTHIYSKMKKGAVLMIGDWFLTDGKTEPKDVKQLYQLRVKEGAQSVFWNTLNGSQTEEDIEKSHAVLNAYKQHHRKLLKSILNRESVYPVTKQWLVTTAKQIGFSVEFDEFVNNINDAVVVLKK